MKRSTMLTVLLVSLFVSLFGSIFGLTGYGKSQPIQLDETLPVQLSSFTAVSMNTGLVKLQWISETETNMLGYNVYRAEENLLSDAIPVNGTVIPANNKSTTTNYSFTDEDVIPGNTYFYWLQSVDLDLTNVFHGPISVMVNEDGEGGTVKPPELSTQLIGAYPNPFNPHTTIEYSIKEETKISLRIYNPQGRAVKTLVEGVQGKGNHSIIWDGKDSTGKEVGSGIYFYRLTTDHYDKTNKMLLVK